MELLTDISFWSALFSIIMIDVALGGDNAVAIALACRRLPPEQQKKGIVYGSLTAVMLRVVLISLAVYLLQVPYLKTVAAALLLYVAWGMVQPSGGDEEHEIGASDKLLAAIKAVVIADLAMSAENVLGVAAAAEGPHSLVLTVLGLAISVPIIMVGSTMVLRLINRFPQLIVGCAMLLGWIAGGLCFSDLSRFVAINELPVKVFLSAVVWLMWWASSHSSGVKHESC